LEGFDQGAFNQMDSSLDLDMSLDPLPLPRDL
jgi:hypothetical protein